MFVLLYPVLALIATAAISAIICISITETLADKDRKYMDGNL